MIALNTDLIRTVPEEGKRIYRANNTKYSTRREKGRGKRQRKRRATDKEEERGSGSYLVNGVRIVERLLRELTFHVERCTLRKEREKVGPRDYRVRPFARV